jgi:hypothetical protein
VAGDVGVLQKEDIYKNIMKKVKLLLAMLLFCVAAKAQTAITPSHLKAAENVLTTMGADTLMKSTTAAMLKQASTRLPQEKHAVFLDVMNKFMAKYLNWDLLKDQIASLYAQEFTEKELKDIVVFYNTPTGKKLIQKMPGLTQKGMQLGQQAVEGHQVELQNMMEDAFKDQ